MFNDKYGLTEAVLQKRKTQTRRLVVCPSSFNGQYVSGYRVCHNELGEWFTYLVDEDEREIEGSYLKHSYDIGEEVAISQNYQDIAHENYDNGTPNDEINVLIMEDAPGAFNKMFVRADIMPHRIRITNIRIERLQDISDEDCMSEGIFLSDPLHNSPFREKFYGYSPDSTNDRYKKKQWFSNPKQAYASLIDKVSGKGVWESNPFVWVYDFELIK